MSVRVQSDFPEITELATGSPFLSNLSYDHRAWIHPMQSYIWMHNKYKACQDILGIEMPKEQTRRFDLLQNARFLEDHSGRSTGKTHNYLVDSSITSICLNLHETVWLGQAKDVGVKVFDTYPGEWIEYDDDFRRFVTAKGNHKPKVSHDQSGATVRFFNGSIMQCLSPDPRKEYKKMQTWRFNHGIFNEWTSWPYIQEIPDKVEPIFTNTNYHYIQTRKFREAMETILGIELGRLSNEDLNGRHRVDDYIPREHMIDALPVRKSRMLELFYENFEMCFGFDYRNGEVDEDLQFDRIEHENDIITFFENYDEGDPTYFNKLVYDGSAKKPSDDCYWLHKFYSKRIKAGDQLYAQYGIGVDDIPVKWDGIIFESTIVEKARTQLLGEDFKRVWLGQWTEGRSKNPFAWTEVVKASREGWMGQLCRIRGNELFAGAVDSAQGSDATFKTNEGVKDARGDDGVVAVYKVGKGTKASPHMLCRVYVAEDVRSEPMAFDIQDIESNYESDFYMMDPGGGGKSVIEKLAKKELSKIDAVGDLHKATVTPMVLWDHEDPGDAKNNICIFSLSNEMITTAYVDSKTGKSLLHYEDQLNNYMVRLMQDALKDGTVAFPQYLEQDQIVDMFNKGEIEEEDLLNLLDMRKALAQLVHLRYVTDKNGRRHKTSHGVYQYEAPGSARKDVAWTILMGYMMCDIIVRLNEIQDDDDEEVPSYYPSVS